MTLQFDTSGDVVSQVGMTMAAIAYAPGQSAIITQLADTTLTAGRWALVWYGVDDASQVYVARDTVTGQQAVAIRGSVTDPCEEAFWLDWFQEDPSVFRMGGWPYGGAPAGASVSHGSLSGLGSLLSLKDLNKQTLVAFLRANPTPNVLTAVVGHSLGGALAYLLAPYLHQEFSPGQNVLDFWPVTFAAPTVGNGTYAAWLQSQFVASVSRYYNSVDVVPHAWQDLEWIAASFPGGPKLPLLLKGVVDGIREILKLLEDSYVQPGTGVQLNGTIVVTDDWVQEAGQQHGSATYLSLVGAPPRTSLPAR